MYCIFKRIDLPLSQEKEVKPLNQITMYQMQTMNTYKKTQVTKMYNKMFGGKAYTKEETIANYETLKETVSPIFQAEIDRRIKKLATYLTNIAE